MESGSGGEKNVGSALGAGAGSARPEEGLGRGRQRRDKNKKKTPLWQCSRCGWYLYLPTEPGCPLCAVEEGRAPSSSSSSDGTSSMLDGDWLPLPKEERRPPWRPTLPTSAQPSSSSSSSATGPGVGDGDETKRPAKNADSWTESEDEDESEKSEGSDEGEEDENARRKGASDDEEDDDDDELEALGGGWRPGFATTAPAGQTNGQQRQVKVYNVGSVGQRKKNAIPPKADGATRFVCISDTHSKHRQLDLPAGDVLIHSGDFSLSCKEAELIDFTEWIKDLPFAHKIVVAGNHDVMMHTEFYERHHWRFHQTKVNNHLELKQGLREACTYLEHELCEINGIKIFGSPWVPYYHDWAFMLPDDEMLKAVWDTIPAGVDVLITHGPPHKLRDNTFHGARAGCPQLASAIFKRVKPAVHCFGHIHDGYGVTKQGRSTFINAATVNGLYKVANSPIVFDIHCS